MAAAVATGLGLTAVTALSWGGAIQRITVAAEPAARYSTVPILLLDAALIVTADTYARRWWPRPRAVAAVAALAIILAAGWATDFRYPVARAAGPASAWEPRASAWLRLCQHTPTATITVTFPDYWGPAKLSNTFSCSRIRS